MPDLQDILTTLQAAVDRKKFRKIDFFKPHPKQFEFIAATKVNDEVMLRAGNQQGKSEAAAYFTAISLTGDYPKNWQGRKWKKAITSWVAGVKGTDVRDIMQVKLFGDPPGNAEALGTGFVPKEAIVDYSMARGVTDLYDTVQVKHLAPGGGGTIDGISTVRFKTYPEGRRGFQGKPVELINLDEEPGQGPGEDGILRECQARTIATSGLIICTLTPLLGRTELILHFEKGGPRIALVKMGLNDALHLTEEQKQAALSKYATAHDRNARLYGDPLMGVGRVFQYEEANLSWMGEPRQEWTKLWGLDWGTTHPFAAVLTAWDRDTDVFYVLHTIRMVGATRLQHISAIRSIAANVPVAWPHDMGRRTESGDNDLRQLAAQYRDPGPGFPGLNMLASHATFPDGSISTSAGVDEMSDRMGTSRFRVSADCADWFEEYRNYHRDEKGLLVKLNDDLLSATRVSLMAKRFGKPGPLGSRVVRTPRQRFASGIDSGEHWGLGYGSEEEGSSRPYPGQSGNTFGRF